MPLEIGRRAQFCGFDLARDWSGDRPDLPDSVFSDHNTTQFKPERIVNPGPNRSSAAPIWFPLDLPPARAGARGPIGTSREPAARSGTSRKPEA
jgi:hypothetical protein